jgi:hypothetical protein
MTSIWLYRNRICFNLKAGTKSVDGTMESELQKSDAIDKEDKIMNWCGTGGKGSLLRQQQKSWMPTGLAVAEWMARRLGCFASPQSAYDKRSPRR